MTKENFQIGKNNIEQQKAFDLVANTNTCLFRTDKADTFASKIKFNFNF